MEHDVKLNLLLASVLKECETHEAHWIQDLREEGLRYGPPKADPVGNFKKKGCSEMGFLTFSEVKSPCYNVSCSLI